MVGELTTHVAGWPRVTLGRNVLDDGVHCVGPRCWIIDWRPSCFILCCSLFKAWDGGRKRERELLLLLLLLLLLPMMMLLLLLTFGREVLAARSSIEDAMLAIQIAVSARWFSSLKFQCS